MDRKASRLAELALASSDATSLHLAMLDWLRGEIGFELAAFHSAVNGAAAMHSLGYDARAALTQTHAYMAEFEPAELAPALKGPVVDTDVLSRRRRDQLALYREQLRPRGVTVMLTSMWLAPGGNGVGFHLARTGRGARFRAPELELAAVLLPTIRLACAFARQLEQERTLSDGSFEAWGEQMGLTTAEAQVAAIVARGLTNREVAKLLGMSVFTVRNHLVSVFRKGNLSTRAELAYVSSTEAPFDPAAKRYPAPPWMQRLRDAD